MPNPCMQTYRYSSLGIWYYCRFQLKKTIANVQYACAQNTWVSLQYLDGFYFKPGSYLNVLCIIHIFKSISQSLCITEAGLDQNACSGSEILTLATGRNFLHWFRLKLLMLFKKKKLPTVSPSTFAWQLVNILHSLAYPSVTVYPLTVSSSVCFSGFVLFLSSITCSQAFH